MLSSGRSLTNLFLSWREFHSQFNTWCLHNDNDQPLDGIQYVKNRFNSSWGVNCNFILACEDATDALYHGTKLVQYSPHLSLTSWAAWRTERMLPTSSLSTATSDSGWEVSRACRAASALCMFRQARHSWSWLSWVRRRSHSARPMPLQGGDKWHQDKVLIRSRYITGLHLAQGAASGISDWKLIVLSYFRAGGVDKYWLLAWGVWSTATKVV